MRNPGRGASWRTKKWFSGHQNPTVQEAGGWKVSLGPSGKETKGESRLMEMWWCPQTQQLSGDRAAACSTFHFSVTVHPYRFQPKSSSLSWLLTSLRTLHIQRVCKSCWFCLWSSQHLTTSHHLCPHGFRPLVVSHLDCCICKVSSQLPNSCPTCLQPVLLKTVSDSVTSLLKTVQKLPVSLLNKTL